jgi:hypothetical protein
VLVSPVGLVSILLGVIAILARAPLSWAPRATATSFRNLFATNGRARDRRRRHGIRGPHGVGGGARAERSGHGALRARVAMRALIEERVLGRIVLTP